jgi:hypothetical protein
MRPFASYGRHRNGDGKIGRKHGNRTLRGQDVVVSHRVRTNAESALYFRKPSEPPVTNLGISLA